MGQTLCLVIREYTTKKRIEDAEEVIDDINSQIATWQSLLETAERNKRELLRASQTEADTIKAMPIQIEIESLKSKLSCARAMLREVSRHATAHEMQQMAGKVSSLSHVSETFRDQMEELRSANQDVINSFQELHEDDHKPDDLDQSQDVLAASLCEEYRSIKGIGTIGVIVPPSTPAMPTVPTQMPRMNSTIQQERTAIRSERTQLRPI